VPDGYAACEVRAKFAAKQPLRNPRLLDGARRLPLVEGKRPRLRSFDPCGPRSPQVAAVDDASEEFDDGAEQAGVRSQQDPSAVARVRHQHVLAAPSTPEPGQAAAQRLKTSAYHLAAARNLAVISIRPSTSRRRSASFNFFAA